ncbi:MAG TPA: hypothetical protein DCF62_04785, partial [Porticoccaceae bacterium]|nr:hypothetical protein [Porticoccaceae bacterium]
MTGNCFDTYTSEVLAARAVLNVGIDHKLSFDSGKHLPLFSRLRRQLRYYCPLGFQRFYLRLRIAQLNQDLFR